MRRSDSTTGSLPCSERAGVSPPPPLATQLFYSTRSTTNTLLSTGVQLKMLRSGHGARVCKEEPCSRHSRQLLSLRLSSSLTALKTSRLAGSALIGQNFHLTFKGQGKKCWPVTGGDDTVRPVCAICIKAMGDLGRPYNRLPCVLNAGKMPVDSSGQLPSPTHPWTARKQLGWNSGNAVQYGPGISPFFGTFVPFTSGNALTKDGSCSWTSVANLPQPSVCFFSHLHQISALHFQNCHFFHASLWTCHRAEMVR